jgi:hypothetical protein
LSGEQDDLAEFADLASFPAVGETDILYVALDTNKLYRWSGSAYVVISETLAIGTTNTTAFAGDRGLALETLTDNIVDGSQALALKDQVIRNTVVGTSPLVVNSIASTTANLTEFQVNGTKVLEVTPAGGLNQNGTRLFTQTGATTNTFFGLSSANSTLTGTEQVAVGESALNGLTNGNRNTAVGRASLLLTTTGADNTAIGTRSGQSNTTGVGNTFIGRDSGNNASQLATATNSTALGHQAFTDKSNQMVFGNASVTEFKFDRNTSATLLAPRITSLSTANLGSPQFFAENTNANSEVSFGTKNDGAILTVLGSYGSTKSSYGITGANDSFLYTNGTELNIVSDNSSGTIKFGTGASGSTERMRITSTGNVGIGTASPNSKLEVAGTISSNGKNLITSDGTSNYIFTQANLYIQSASGGSTLGVITSTGHVGIGTTSPTSLLTVGAAYGGTPNGESRLAVQNSGNVYLTIGAGTTSDSGILFADSSDNDVGVIGYNHNTNHMGFVVNASERLRITSTGNVGIGTTAPAEALQISSGNLRLTNGTAFSTANSLVREINVVSGSANQFITSSIGFRTGAFSDEGVITFGTALNASSPTERMRILSTGLVGINETAPSAQLQVKSGATTRVPLIVDTISGFDQALGLEEFRVNTSVVARINGFGSFATLGSIFNLTNINNANITPASTGTSITRNIADTNPALIVNLANASATGNIQVWQKAGSAVAQISNAGIFVGQSRPTRTDITANATLALADEGKVLRVNPVTAADNITITVPPNGDVAFVVDTEIAIVRFNTGTVTIVAGSGVTIRSKNSETKISGQYGSVALKKIGENEWVLVGSLEA